MIRRTLMKISEKYVEKKLTASLGQLLISKWIV